MLRKISFCFIVLFGFIISPLIAEDLDHLKKSDISRIMDQIFSEHLGQKQIDEKILQQSFKTYIEQFDPDKTYLLETEVTPFLNYPPKDIQNLISQYKKGNFAAYAQLNALIQKSITRAKNIRKSFLKNPNEIFNATNTFSPSMDGNSDYATNESQLKKRIFDQMVLFIQLEQKRYGKDQVTKYKDKLLPLFDQALSKNEENYIFESQGKPFSSERKENAETLHILKSLASAIDAHTAFFSNSEAYDLKVRLEKQFEGIGVILQETPEGVIISSLVNGGPASKSGKVFVDDKILEINGHPVADGSVSDVIDKIRDSKSRSISLLLSRNIDQGGKDVEKKVTVTLEKEAIQNEKDRLEVRSEKVGNGVIGLITLHSFYQNEEGEGSDTDIKKAIENLDKNGNLRGLVLDLRENSGGFLTQAVKVAGLFISNGVIVISKYSDGEEKLYRDVDNHTFYKGPLVVLTSKATASAAEIVAQALQDYGVAIIVGDERTYGKGTIQSQTVTGNHDAASYFKVTVGKYYTVSGKTPQLQGVKSDIVVLGPYSQAKIGEEFLDHPLKPDSIKAEYNDDLSDVAPGLRSWYMKYYTPTIQHKIKTWNAMIPVLQKNSNFRVQNNKNYQLFLKELKDGKIDMPLFMQNNDSEEKIEEGKKNIGHEDIQMQEAVNIVKDMIYLQNKDRLEPAVHK